MVQTKEERRLAQNASARRGYYRNIEKQKARQKAWRESNKEYHAERNREWRKKNPEKTKVSHRKSSLKNKNNPTVSRSPEYRMLHSAKRSSKLRGCDFDLELSDIVIPTHCPILKTPLKTKLVVVDLIDYDYDRDNSPSIDRVDNNKGYTKDNIRIISTRANQLKGALTIELCEIMLSYMKGEI